MDHLERVRRVPAGLASVGVAVLILVVAACGSGSETSSSNGLSSDGGTPDAVEDSEQPTLQPGPSELSGAADSEPTSTEAPIATPSPSARPAPTATPLPALLGLDAELVADGFDQPVLVTGAPGTDALFVVEREGLIRVVEDGLVAADPFLDLRDQLTSSSIEQGLLGLEFSPDYADTGRFFAYWTMPDGNSRLAEFDAAIPTLADPTSMQVLLDIDQPAERHNAGMIVIGPDGLLYLALGDGGSGGTTAQDTTDPLGSIVRLDVTNRGSYSIPPGNPYDNEVWVNGLRNPWRFSIDPVEGLVYIGDVGQDTFEEINVVALDGAGTNFGWLSMEGDECFVANCDPTDLTVPVVQYTHAEGCSVTGGSVYRGDAIPELVGHYLFADWCDGFVRSFRYLDGAAQDQQDWSADLFDVGQVTSFGVDNESELYTVNWAGQLFKIVPKR